MTEISEAIDRSEFSREEIDEARKNNGLLTFGIELSTYCNFSCVYCYREAGRRSPDELSLEELLDASKQAIALGARKVGVVGAGEPTLDRKLVPLLEFLCENVKGVSLFTNGSGIDAALARKLYDLRVRVTIKLNSLFPSVHDILVGKQDGYELMMRGLDALLDVGYPSNGRRITVESVIVQDNLNELPDLWKWCRDRGFSPFFERLTPMGRAIGETDDLTVSPDQLLRLFQELKTIDESRYGRTWTIQPPWPAQRCSRHFYNCLIDAQGNVLPCSGVNIAVGNIRKQSLSTMLASSSVIDDLRHIDKKIKGYCALCNLRHRCYGCRGAAYHLTGDYLAADPLCWRATGAYSQEVNL